MATGSNSNSGWTRAVSDAELVEGSRLVVKAGDQDVLVLRHRGLVYAMEARCPHMGRQLKDAHITDDGFLICPLHHSEFELTSGRCRAWAPWPPVFSVVLGAVRQRRDLRVFATKVKDGTIWVKAD